ncbi:MAG: 2-oxoacid:acceptor oxidoreductase family protein [Gammaproteobacteria bacterium]|nr:2-oxoacid:acceptor oxidoreductase family protein [Gammaproteobacteria bacterium]MDH3750090.1 2-oxoacid:acceptor oxidoreductase family protein [Gammaproteobacteria bacterium]MDH3805421.1 2-oxoacid:acceptor oxidoreductase family protein [Gammaproteobacteria bacterium]
MNDSIEIRLGGVGGQGIALAGTLLGNAAALYDDKEAVFTQTYGPEARGGASRADIIISDNPIAYPFVTRPHVVAVLFQEAYEKFGQELAPGGLLIVENDLVNARTDDADVVRLPAVKIAEELGNKLAANIVVLGYLIGATNAVSLHAMEEAIRATVNARHLDLDMQALNAGFTLAVEAGND